MGMAGKGCCGVRGKTAHTGPILAGRSEFDITDFDITESDITNLI